MRLQVLEVRWSGCLLIGLGKGAEPGDGPLRRPGVPVPDVMRHGISDSQTKDLAQTVTVYVNKLLGGGSHPPSGWRACFLRGRRYFLGMWAVAD